MERISLTKTNIERIKSPKSGRKIVWDKSRPKLCLRITEKGVKSFYYVTKYKGRTEWVRLGRYPDMPPAAARVRADREAAAFALGDNPAEERRQEKAEWTVEQAYEMYRKKNEQKGGKSLESIDGYWRLHFSKWSSKRLSQVTGRMAEKLQDRILEDRSGATANRVISTGRALFNFSTKRKDSGFDGPNPFDGLEKLPEKRRKTRLRVSQIPAFFKALDGASPLMKDFIMMALWTGRRAGDLKSMRWVDLDLDGGTWLIPDTKAGEPQEVALSDPAIEILARRRKEVLGQWVFPSRAKSGHIEVYKKAWHQVRDEASLGDLRLHDFRRSLSSIAQENRIAATVAGAQLGHKDPSTTMKYYTDIALYVQRDAVNVVAQVILEAAESDKKHG